MHHSSGAQRRSAQFPIVCVVAGAFSIIRRILGICTTSCLRCSAISRNMSPYCLTARFGFPTFVQLCYSLRMCICTFLVQQRIAQLSTVGSIQPYLKIGRNTENYVSCVLITTNSFVRLLCTFLFMYMHLCYLFMLHSTYLARFYLTFFVMCFWLLLYWVSTCQCTITTKMSRSSRRKTNTTFYIYQL